MTEIRTGLRHILAFPRVYDFYQRLVGGYAWRKSVVEEFVLMAIPHGGLILDIGCGTVDILNYLPSGYRYVGFDRNPNYINKARARYTHKNARFTCEELSPDFTLNGRQADVVLTLGVLHHLDDIQSEDFFKVARTVIKPDGFLLAMEPVYDSRQSFLAWYIVSRDRGTAVRTEAAYKALALKGFSSVETHIHSNPLRIPFTGIVMKCKI